jgi:agmatine/peptidylarginine deiminase
MPDFRASRSSSLLPLFVAATLAAQDRAGDRYPEGSATPRQLTAEERAILAQNPLTPPEVPTAPPTGPLHCPGEYEPCDGVLLAWEGPSSWTLILQQMAVAITTIGQATVYMVVDTTGEEATVRSALTAAGADVSRVQFLVTTTDTIWIRDYGPRYVFEGDTRIIVDHTYNRPRPNDNLLPTRFASYKKHTRYEHALIHGGGNYHLSSLGDAHSTKLILNENPSLSAAQVVQIWKDYLNVATLLYDPFPTSVDLTQHIDMWMQVIGDRTVVISDWPLNVGTIQDVICDAAAASMAQSGYTVHRVPARSVNGIHYTYTNIAMCNDLVLVPSYTQSQVVQHNPQALLAWQAAVPGKTVVQINCEAIVSAAGVMHCICMHVPKHRGGAIPTAYLRSPNGGETLIPNTLASIAWNTDDDLGVVSCDLLLSSDGGRTFQRTIAAGIPPTGSFPWIVPDLYLPDARIRVVARDAQGNTGFDDSDASFAIVGQGCRASSLAYGTGKPGQNGTPVLGSQSEPVLGALWQMRLLNGPQSGTALVLVGAQRASLPFDGGTLLVDPITWFGASLSPSGSADVVVPVPNEVRLCGAGVFWQAWLPNDPGASGFGFSASQGLEGRLGH